MKLTQPKLITSHPFTLKDPSAHDDFHCARCSHPRALHADDGFIANRTPSTLPSEGQYKGFQKPEITM
jgi:hypothetical protein